MRCALRQPRSAWDATARRHRCAARVRARKLRLHAAVRRSHMSIA